MISSPSSLKVQQAGDRACTNRDRKQSSDLVSFGLCSPSKSRGLFALRLLWARRAFSSSAFLGESPLERQITYQRLQVKDLFILLSNARPVEVGEFMHW